MARLAKWLWRKINYRPTFLSFWRTINQGFEEADQLRCCD